MYKDRNYLQFKKISKNNNFAIYFNCISFCWGAEDKLIQISDSKNRKRNLGNEKIKITDEKVLTKFVKNKLKDVALGKIIDTVFRNETEHLVHEMQCEEISRSDNNYNYLDFLIKKTDKFTMLERNQTKEEIGALRVEEKRIIELRESTKKELLRMVEQKQNKPKKQQTMSMQNQFVFIFKNFAYIHDLNSKTYYIQNILKKNSSYENFEQEIVKFDIIQWKKKSDFYNYCISVIPIFFRFFNFNKMHELIQKIDQSQTIMELLFDYDLNSKSFKELFFIFIIELMINSLNLIDYIVKISHQIKFNLKIDLERISIKNFLLFLKQNLPKIISELKNKKKAKKVTQIDGIQMEDSFVFECHTYQKFNTKRYQDGNLSHKRVFLQKLVNCQFLLFQQQNHVAQLQLDQIIKIGKMLKDIYQQIKIDNMKKFQSKYTHNLQILSVQGYPSNSKSKSQKRNYQKKELSCSICKIKIDGLIYLCINCLHGGHFEHIKQWFDTYDYCPECINCKCTLEIV